MGVNVSDLPPKAQEQVFRKMQAQKQEKQRKYHNQLARWTALSLTARKRRGGTGN